MAGKKKNNLAKDEELAPLLLSAAGLLSGKPYVV
jgi:hypothetical protein